MTSDERIDSILDAEGQIETAVRALMRVLGCSERACQVALNIVEDTVKRKHHEPRTPRLHPAGFRDQHLPR